MMSENLELWWLVIPVLAGLVWMLTLAIVASGIIKRRENWSVIGLTNEICKSYFYSAIIAAFMALFFLFLTGLIYFFVFSFLQDRGVISKELDWDNFYLIAFALLIHFLAQCKAYHLAIRDWL